MTLLQARRHWRGAAPKLTSRQQRLYDFLHAHPVGVLSTVSPEGNPHGVVVYFTIDEDFTVHFLTKTGTRKYDNLVHHNHVTLTVFTAATQTTVEFTGVAQEDASNDAINRVAGAVFGASSHTSDSGLPPIVKLEAGRFTTFAIKPVQIRMAVYADHDTGGYRDIFESLESFELKT